MKTKIIIITVSILMLVGGFWIFNVCRDAVRHRLPRADGVSTEDVNPYKGTEIKAVIIPAENNTFGYDIYVYGAVLIHQPSRPGLPGNEGFATEEDAMKVAELVMKKIRNNEMPPTVTVEELRALGVLH